VSRPTHSHLHILLLFCRQWYPMLPSWYPCLAATLCKHMNHRRCFYFFSSLSISLSLWRLERGFKLIQGQFLFLTTPFYVPFTLISLDGWQCSFRRYSILPWVVSTRVTATYSG
jgi:hypothetical protein